MKYSIIILAFLSFQLNFAQETEASKKITSTFQTYFNAQNVDKVFELYTTEMQEAMTKEGVTKFVNGCFKQFGKLSALKFLETTEGIHRYDATFEKTHLILELQLQDNQKIVALQFQEP